MKVSHEAPIPYMKQITGMIDYDYCLPPLLDESDEYKNYLQEDGCVFIIGNTSNRENDDGIYLQ